MPRPSPHLGAKRVVSVDRITKTSGGKMRPRVRAYHQCTLECGHVVEKLKGSNEQGPPKHMKCILCLENVGNQLGSFEYVKVSQWYQDRFETAGRCIVEFLCELLDCLVVSR